MVSGKGTTVVFVECLVTRSNVYENVKIFEIVESRKLRGRVDDTFGLKRFFSFINTPDRLQA